MFTVSNPKVGGFAPVWAPYTGFSLLFDNPGRSQTRLWKGKNVSACDLNDPAVTLYKTIYQWFTSIDLPLMTSAFGLCPLPPHSLHVTVLSGITAGNVSQMNPHFVPTSRELFSGLPESWNEQHSVVKPYASSELALNKSWRIHMKFKRLEMFGQDCLVAILDPADTASGANFEQMRKVRANLVVECNTKFGLQRNPHWTPHLSLGYFANRELGVHVYPRIAEWNEFLIEKTRGMTVDFESVSAYGFTDMATFFKV